MPQLLEVTEDVEWNPYDRNCPSRNLLDRIGDRWTVLIIGFLDDGPRRYTEISRALDGISQKVLTQALKGLLRDGLVSRTAYPEIPPRVEYELTELGHSLFVTVRSLTDWARSNMSEVLEARQRYDSATTPRG